MACTTCTILLEALVEAQEHLEYCGYGDRWEREVARELHKKIQNAIDAAKADHAIVDQRVRE
jgi:hypothetical protein